MDPSKDYYAVLGVLPSIERAAIRAVYLALLKKYHPDICKTEKNEATRRMKEINEAYNILGDDKCRENYDTLRGDFYSKYLDYQKKNKEKNLIRDNIDKYCQSYEELRAGRRQNKAKATNYRDPWTAKQHDSQGGDRLPILVVGVVASVALAFIVSAFGGWA